MPADPSSPKDWRDDIEQSFARGKHERRHGKRSICNIPVQLRLEGDPPEQTAVARSAVVRNLSEIGAFLATDPFPVGTRLRFKLQNEKEERLAEVVWLEDPGPSARVRTIRGVGVRFLPVAAVAGP